MYEPTHQPHPQPTPEALAEADTLSRLSAGLYALAANDAEQAGDEPRAQGLWQRAHQNLTPVTDDAHATPAQLLTRAGADCATGWGRPTTH